MENVPRSQLRREPAETGALTGARDGCFSAMIDVHAHAFPPSWLAAVSKLTGQPTDAIKVGTVSLPHWSVERHLQVMDSHGIASSILSWPAAAAISSGNEARALTRRMNEEFAE